MNKIANKINKIVLIIFITLISMATMVSAGSVTNPSTDKDLSDAAKDATLGAKDKKDQEYFEFDPTKIIGKWIDASDTKGDSKAPYQHIGEYCIDARTSANGSDDFIIRNIIDLTPEGKIISYYYAGKEKVKVNVNGKVEEKNKIIVKTVESENATLVKALKSMSYCSIKSIKAEEGRIKNGDAWKVAIAGIVDDNLSKMGTDLKLYKGFQQPMDEGSSKKKAEAAKESKDKAYTARFIFLYGDGKQNQIIFGAKEGEGRGDLTITKTGGGNKKLGNVGFQLQHNKTGKWVKNPTNSNKAEYVDRSSATTFSTADVTGQVTIKGLLMGDYTLYETVNPNYGYVCNPSQGISVATVKSGKDNSKLVTNKQVYVKLSGYVWVDKPDGKTGFERNDHFKTSLDGSQDAHDLLFNGIKVRLINSRTGEVKETTTGKLNKYTTSGNNGNGEYEFKDVLISELPNLYVEFEYDGLTYQNVPKDFSKESGSKAIENGRREAFNAGFSVIEGETATTGIRRNTNGEAKNDLVYDLTENGKIATLTSAGKTTTADDNSCIKQDSIGNYIITSNTKDSGYVLHDPAGEEEIKYINLGLYERDQPDITLGKDIANVRLSINGNNHIYEYNQRYLNEGEYTGKGFNVGVKFPEKFQGSYTRAIYQSDFDYESPDKEKSNELEVFVTYKIAMLQANVNLKAKVNSVVDYYDSRYTLVGVGDDINQDASLAGVYEASRISDNSYNDKYRKVVIQNNTDLDPQQTKYIYVQFKLDRELVKRIISNQELALDNVAEINSYSVFDMAGNTYAGIDHNSNPGNAEPEQQYFENDTDKSPSLGLDVADARKMTGKVFLDETTGELKTGEIRQGDGEYTENEQGIQGVQINLVDHKGSQKSYQTETNENGDFVIENFIPGDYTLTYTWGGQTYKLEDGNDKEITVQDYKGTIYKEKDRQNNRRWWHSSANPENKRYSDAMDNYQTRKDIDAEMANVKYDVETETKRTIHTMDSTTPTMEIGVEYDTVYSASAGDKYVYEIAGVDFGIVERARQDIALSKRVTSLKLMLANGQVINDLTIEEDEKGNRVVTGERNGVTYMKPDANTTAGNGFIRLELDSELIQGARLEVGYEIKLINQSEKDYIPTGNNDPIFYLYGEINDTQQVITIKPTGIIDYLDNGWSFDHETYTDWQVKELKDIIEGDNKLIDDTVYQDNEESTIATRKILYTDKFKDDDLVPGDGRKLDFKVSKLLSTSDEISLDNEVEVVELNRPGGSTPESIPGNYVPGTGATEADDSMAETTIVTPATGENQNYILPVIIGTTACIILGAGIIFIKKKVM